MDEIVRVRNWSITVNYSSYIRLWLVNGLVYIVHLIRVSGIDLVYTEHLIRVLISNFLSNYFNFGNAFTECTECTKVVQYASRWSIKYMYHVYIYTYRRN